MSRPASAEPLRHRCVDRVVDAEQVFARLFGPEPYAFWLDSRRLGPATRFSFLGASAGPSAEVLTARVGRGVRLRTGHETTYLPGSIFDVLAERLGTSTVPDPAPLPVEAACGYVGYFGYELYGDDARPARHVSPGPDAVWLRASRFVVVDHRERRTWVVAEESDATWLDEATDGVARLEPASEWRLDPTHVAGVDPEPWLVRPRAMYERDIEVCLEALRAGDSYELCLTNTAELPTNADPFEVYRRLRRTNPAPYAAYLRLGDVHVLSSSPERFLTIGPDRVAQASPIKGTAPRSTDAATDAARVKELRDSPKTRAENLMIVDLMRNDLGRVCEPGTVAVPDFLAVESYATVHQLVSTIQGRLRGDVDAVAAARACFPPGSMTGAPKLASVRILDGLETRARGIYSGALGMFARTGTADLSVVIRTAVVQHGQVTVGAGGAIVLDSDPVDEYAEMLLKAAAPLRAFPQPGR